MEPLNGQIIPLTIDQIDEAMQLTKSIGWTIPEAKWKLYFAIGESFSYVVDDTIIGCITHFRFDDALSSIANVIVHPQAQRRGVGRSLLVHVLPRTARVVKLIATDAGIPLYERIGFQTRNHVIRMQRISSSQDFNDQDLNAAPAPPFSLHRGTYERTSIIPMSWVGKTTIDRLTVLDAQQTGARRSALFRSLQETDSAWLLSLQSDDSGNSNEAICVIFDNVLSIGPVFVKNPSHAEKLLSTVTQLWHGEIRMDVSIDATEWMTFAQNLGFIAHRTSPLMTYASRQDCIIPPPRPQITCFDAATT